MKRRPSGEGGTGKFSSSETRDHGSETWEHTEDSLEKGGSVEERQNNGEAGWK